MILSLITQDIQVKNSILSPHLIKRIDKNRSRKKMKILVDGGVNSKIIKKLIVKK